MALIPSLWLPPRVREETRVRVILTGFLLEDDTIELDLAPRPADRIGRPKRGTRRPPVKHGQAGEKGSTSCTVSNPA